VKRGKRYRAFLERFDREKLYTVDDALGLLAVWPVGRFDEAVEGAVRLGVDPRHADQLVRGSVMLPHGTGKAVRVLVFAKGDREAEAQEAGADFVGAEELVARVSEGWTDFDVAIAAPDMMGQVGRLGRLLGPRGLMPNPRSGTVTTDIGRSVREAKGGRVEFRVDRGSSLHVPLGRLSFDVERLRGNFAAFMDNVLRARPPAAKGQYVRTVTLSSTMSPGIPVDRQDAMDCAQLVQ
jgi:large subunit ribosomal protein L1